MPNEEDGILLKTSPALSQAVDELTKAWMDMVAAFRELAVKRPELFTTPADEIARMLATWD